MVTSLIVQITHITSSVDSMYSVTINLQVQWQAWGKVFKCKYKHSEITKYKIQILISRMYFKCKYKYFLNKFKYFCTLILATQVTQSSYTPVIMLIYCSIQKFIVTFRIISLRCQSYRSSLF